ncbi:MAG: S-layer homology domain-containing protein [Clostridia bacterium]|nr:S-layer homology domain-containing protein [Clostridia bacterium]
MRKWIGLLLSIVMLFNLALVPSVVCAAPKTYYNYESEFLKELRAETNFYSNPGFELTDGVLTGWNDGGVLSYTTDVVYNGGSAAKVVSKLTSSWQLFTPNPTISIKEGRYYLLSTMMAWGEGNTNNIVLYPGAGLDDIDPGYGDARNNEHVSPPAQGEPKWKNGHMVVQALNDSEKAAPIALCYSDGAEYYLDDIYFSELMVAGIDCSAIVRSAVIPKDNEAEVKIALSGTAYNQAGDNEGLEGDVAPVVWSLAEEKQGVRIEGNNLIIDSKASSDTTVKVVASCNPSILDYQLEEEDADLKNLYLKGREEVIEITLTPNDYTLPRALDIILDGEPTPGTTISCDYTYAQVEGKTEGTPEYQWYCKTPEEADYSPIEGANEKEFDIPEDYPEGCAFIVKITPKTQSGVPGETFTSGALMEPMAPIVKDVKIIGTFENDFAIGDTLTAKYTYIDGNDFGVSKEGGTVITWYRLDREEEVEIGTGETYTLTEDEADHYVFVKVIPVSKEEPNDDTEYPSESIWVSEEHKVPMAEILQARRDGSNLIKNSSFEDFNASNTPSSWTIQSTSTWAGLIATTSFAYRGDYSAFVAPKERTDIQKLYFQSITGKPQKIYLISAMAIPTAGNTAGLIMYTSGGTSVDTDETQYPALASGATPEWRRLTRMVKNENTTDISIISTVTCWTAGNTYYVDDFYVGELMVADIDCSKTETEVTIPTKGSVEVELIGTAYNQLGTLDGFTNGEAPITWSLKAEKQGVYIEGDKLIVTDMASSDTKVKVLATCNPTFMGADAQEDEVLLAGRTKTVEITLLPNNSVDPRAENVRIDGRVELGSTLECKYDYAQVDGELEEGTEIQWFYKNVDATDYKPIEPLATGKYYTIASGYEDKHIIAKVTPKTEKGKVGKTVSSPYVVYPKAPVAKDVTIKGTFAVDEVLTASYTFFDDNGDGEGNTTYRWVRMDGETETPIGTEKTYKVTEDDVDKKIRVYVAPASDEEPYTDGTEHESSLVYAAAKPVATKVSIKKLSGDLLGASFKYTHPCNISQGESIYEWYVKGKRVGTGTTLDASTYGNSEITLKVTPVATLKPFEGETVSATYKKSSGGGAGGAGGGGAPSRVVVSPTPIVVPDIDTKPEAGKDNLEKYSEWMRDGIQFVLSNGIMENVSENEFMPQEKITRAEFLICVMKTLGLGESEYTEIFGDISDADAVAKYLQTAVDKGIISRDTNFYPNRNVSRAEICKILIAAVKAAYPEAQIQSADLAFADSNQIQSWAYGYVQQAVGIKLLNGMSATEFAPLGDVTRAQTATMVMRLHNFAETEKGDK